MSTARVLQFPVAERAPIAPPEWSRDAVAGLLVEVCGPGSLTFVARLVLDAQQQGENAAWVTVCDPFFPPDMAGLGVDLAALPIVRARQSGPAGRAADHLLRSGAFGLVVMDLGRQSLPMPLQARLQHMARAKGAALVCMTEKDRGTPSLSSLVALRMEVGIQRMGQARFGCSGEAIKDKRRGPGWSVTEVCHGPPGLR